MAIPRCRRTSSEKRTAGYFYRTVNRARAFQTFGTYDPFASRVYWAFPTGEEEINDRIMVYDYALDRWAELAVDTYVLSRMATAAVSMEGGADDENMDLPGLPSLDNRAYMAGVPLLIAVGRDRKLSTFDGPNLAATLQTGSYNFAGTKRVRMRNAMSYFEGNGAEAVTMKVEKRQRYGDAWIVSETIPQQQSGFYRMNADGMFHRFEFNIPAGTDWSHAHGWEPSFIPTTER